MPWTCYGKWCQLPESREKWSGVGKMHLSSEIPGLIMQLSGSALCIMELGAMGSKDTQQHIRQRTTASEGLLAKSSMTLNGYKS